MSIRQEVELSETSELIELYSLDLTAFGDNVYYFIAGSLGTEPVVWQSHTYIPFDLEASGFEYDGKGSAPTPTIKFSLTNPILTAYIQGYDDLIGAKITRTKTYRKYLDDAPTANPTAHYPLDIYRIERKARENRIEVEFELSSVLDQQGRKLPARTVTAGFCPWVYRRPNGSGGFTYHTADNACPYAGSSYFTLDGVPTSSSNDRCAKHVEACKLRFGEDAVLPFGGFPGASRSLL